MNNKVKNFWERNGKKIKNGAIIVCGFAVGASAIIVSYKCGVAVGLYSFDNFVTKTLTENNCTEAIEVLTKAAKALCNK